MTVGLSSEGEFRKCLSDQEGGGTVCPHDWRQRNMDACMTINKKKVENSDVFVKVGDKIPLLA